ncbi:unnamed protein product [Moneuplotes crassus]|uniref:Uncharacterized protein n=1 Tax=Euplotes crassus TaxID=5936 RepID=A0AAD1Y5Y2_EUPCR|nr:unnamed protein product [Moneuplotes crassus]
MENLDDYTQMMTQKEEEIRNLAILKAKKLESVLRSKDAVIKDLESQIESLNEQVINNQTKNDQLEETLKEHEEKFVDLSQLFQDKDEQIETLQNQLDALDSSKVQEISSLEQNLLEEKEKCDKLESILKELEWAHDQIKKDHDEELDLIKSQNDEVKRRAEMLQQETRDEVEKMYRAKITQKDLEISKIQEKLDSETRRYNQGIAAVEFENKNLSKEMADLKSKVISTQAENDDMASQLTIKQIDQNKLIEKQKLKIGQLEADIEAQTSLHKERVRDLSQQVEKLLQETHSKDLELTSLKERTQYDIKTVEERCKLDKERLENNYKFQMRKQDDKILDLEREVERLRLKEDASTNKIISLERSLTHHTDRKDQEWKSKFEANQREMMDLKQSLQEKTNKNYLMKEKLDSVELNLESKNNECKKLRFEIRECEDRIRELEDQGHSALKKLTKGSQNQSEVVKSLQDRILELEKELREKHALSLNHKENANHFQAKEIAFSTSKKSKKSKKIAFDDLGLDDDLSDDSLLRDGSEANITEKLLQIKPERDGPAENFSLEALQKENQQLKLVITEMKDEMEKIAGLKAEKKMDRSASELNFYMNTNKKLLSQLDSEKERLDILDKEVEIKAKELEIANSAITNLSKKMSLKDKDIAILIEKLKQQKGVIVSLKAERDKLVGISNDLREELSYKNKLGDSQSQVSFRNFNAQSVELEKIEAKKQDSVRSITLECVRCREISQIQTKNQEIQCNTIMEVPRYSQEDLEVRSNDRYKCKPEMMISQSVALDQNDEIQKLNDEVNHLRETVEDLKIDHMRDTIEEIRKSGLGVPMSEDEEAFNPNSIEMLLKHREELNKEIQVNHGSYDSRPERDTGDYQEAEMRKKRKDKVVKNRLAELKNVYEQNLDEFMDESEPSVY